MIPTIEDIVLGLLDGSMTEKSALAWLYQHMENFELRDHFAGMAMQGYMGPDYDMAPSTRAREAYMMADAMLKERSK